MASKGRMGFFAVAAAALVVLSIFVLWDMPADPGTPSERALTYMSIVIFILGLTLIGPVIYYMRNEREDRVGLDSRPEEAGEPDPSDETDLDDYVSDIEREFQALEMEIDREEKG